MGLLDGKAAIVTGSARGIGRATAELFAGEGAKVLINDLDGDVAEQAAGEISGETAVFSGDLTKTGACDEMVAAAVDAFGGVDIVVNNAGYTWDGVIQKMSDAQWQAMLDCHLTAPFRILRAVQPVLRDAFRADQEAGRRIVRKVVNVSSVAGLFGNAGQANYSAAKAGIVGMTQTLAKEWGRIGVTVNCVAFGLIRTRLTDGAAGTSTASIEGRDIRLGVNADLLEMLERTIPLGRAGTPEEAADAIYLMCIPESDYVSGHTLLCSGGLTGM